MKKFIVAPIAAVVMLGVSGAAFAGYDDKTGVDIYKQVKITNNTYYKGGASIHGSIGINKLGMAVIDNYQNTSNNEVENFRNTNNASISGGSGNHMAGNGGINVAGGDNNVQSNNTAMTVLGDSEAIQSESEARRSGGGKGNSHWDKHGGASVDAEIGSNQVSAFNDVENKGNHNNASISGGSLNNSAGNLGVNVAAGNGNVQANNFALSYGTGASMAVSTVDNKQFTTGNTTTNTTLTTKREGETVGITLFGGAIGGYEGTSVQSNNVYPELWIGGNASNGHLGGNYWGHADFDGAPGAGGDSPSSGNDGHFEFAEKGEIALGIVMVGGVKTYNTIEGRTNINNASLSGGSLNWAAGNVGVNVASGTNNLQSNNMALSVGNF